MKEAMRARDRLLAVMVAVRVAMVAVEVLAAIVVGEGTKHHESVYPSGSYGV
jgi:hypothetical protein